MANPLSYIYDVKEMKVMKTASPTTSTVTEFSKYNIKLIRSSFEAKFKELEKEFGIRVGLGTIRFTGSDFRAKVTASAMSKSTPKDKQTSGSIKVGDVFSEKRSIYTVTAINNPGVFKYSVVTQNGKRYKIKPDNLLSMTKIK